DLVAGIEGVEFIVLEKPNSPLDYWRFKRKMASRTFDVLCAAQASFRANFLYACIKAKRKIGYDTVRARDGHRWFINESIRPGRDHTLEGFLKFAEGLGQPSDVRLGASEQAEGVSSPSITDGERAGNHVEHSRAQSVVWNLPINAEAEAWVAAQTFGPRPWLIVNAAASKSERTWLLDRYITVIRETHARFGGTVILVGGPGELDRQLADGIRAECSFCIDIVGRTRLPQLLSLIRHADVVLCPDTGPSHMAAAVGTPVVALHAVTSAQVSGPYPFLDLVVDYYPEAIQHYLNKNMQTVEWTTQVHGNETMRLVPVEPVLEKLFSVLSAK
ncbi:MAG: glycosyltransferase family 9 protein, partial [Legionellaceae bacterium]|nr:glycosyltransferase family 9 protein [Legionellaceae bacterium]